MDTTMGATSSMSLLNHGQMQDAVLLVTPTLPLHKLLSDSLPLV